MKPDKEGMWIWYDANGDKMIVPVINPYKEIGFVCLKVYSEGGYYSINDEEIGTEMEKYCKAEWPDRWGEYVGPLEN